MESKEVLIKLSEHILVMLQESSTAIGVLNQERLDTTHEMTTSKLNSLNIQVAKIKGEQEALSDVLEFIKERTDV